MPLVVGIVGAGGIASKLHLPQLSRMSEVKIKWFFGRKEHRLRLLSERYGAEDVTGDYHDILQDPEVDAVVIATPHPLHVKPGIEALQAGKHVLMQKPLCGDMEEANRFVEAADTSDRIVFALPHFMPQIYKMRALVGEGKIGRVSGAYCRTSHGGPEVYYAEVKDTFGEKGEDLWFFDAKRASVGALFDMGVYAVANLVAAMGSVVEVLGYTATLAKPTELEDTATLLLKFENGALGTAETGWCDPARTWRLSIHGTTGKLTATEETELRLIHWEPGSYTREDVPPVQHAVDVKDQDLGNAHECFYRCIQENRRPRLSHAWAARHVTEILLAGLASAETGRPKSIVSRAEPPD
jgi:predicted dehydrogenase